MTEAGAGEYMVAETDELWANSVGVAVDALSETIKTLRPEYEAYDTSPKAVANRTYIAATKELVGIASYWFNSNTTYYQSVLPIDKDEMIRRLDQLVRTLRHTR